MHTNIILPHLLLFALPIHSHTHPSQQPLQPPSSLPLNCPIHNYTINLISHTPLLIHIPNFLTPAETTHLSSLATTNFTRSNIADSSGSQRSASTRTSRSASLSARDNIIRCIEERARVFQSPSLPRAHMEPLQLVKYGIGEAYAEHTDWFTNPAQTGPEVGGNRKSYSRFRSTFVHPLPKKRRSSKAVLYWVEQYLNSYLPFNLTHVFSELTRPGVSSFFVYLHISRDIVGGGTRFPWVDAPGTPSGEALGTGVFRAGTTGRGEEWCGVLDCDEPWENGLTVRPVEGSAVFWMNLLPGGRGDERTLHAGLPVLRGEKVGMNIWTREGPLDWEYRGDD